MENKIFESTDTFIFSRMFVSAKRVHAKQTRRERKARNQRKQSDREYECEALKSEVTEIASAKQLGSPAVLASKLFEQTRRLVSILKERLCGPFGMTLDLDTL